MAEALFAALVSDTGSFAQANATPECFSQASDLVSLGVDPERINQRLKAPWSQAKLRLLGAALSGLRLSHGGRLATMVLSQPMLESLGASLEEAEGFIEYARRTEGALAAAVVKPDGRGAVKVSLRSHSGVNVRALAQVFGGGGHDQAAAYTYPGQDPSQAADILEAEAGAIFQGLEP
jgi:phosphoesterase RecJ-like protein